MLKRTITIIICLSALALLTACDGFGNQQQQRQPQSEKTTQSTNAATDTISIIINGQLVDFPAQEPIIVNGQVLACISEIFVVLDFGIDWLWNSEIQQGTMFRTGHHVLVFTVGDEHFTRNGVEHSLDVPIQLMGNRMMVPIRPVMESIGLNVDWDDDTWAVIVSMPEPAIRVGLWDYITIEGDEEFVRATNAALSLMREETPETYAMVLRYLHTIVQEGRRDSGLHRLQLFNNIDYAYVVPSRIYTQHTYVFAGVIVHYAIHARQQYELFNNLLDHFEAYDDAPYLAWNELNLIRITRESNPVASNNISDAVGYSRFENEQEALKHEIEFLIAAGVPESRILSLEAGIGTIWWDECRGGSCLCELHRLRWLMSQ